MMQPEGRVVRKQVVEIANDLVGSKAMRYVSDHPELGQSPDDGFDCSGFVTFVLSQAGLEIPRYIGYDNQVRNIRHCNEYLDYYGALVHEDCVEPGDLLFFSRQGWMATHMGIVVDDGLYVHAPGSDGRVVERAEISKETIIPRIPADRKHAYTVNPIAYKSLVLPHPNPSYRTHQCTV